jgi:2-dehydropantoate 2-reductase
VGPLAPDGAPAARRAHALLSDAGLDPEWHDDMRSQVWWKAIANHAVNPLAATQGLANGRLLDDPWWTQVMAVAGEAHAVGRAAGVALPGPPSQLVHAIRGTLARTAENRNSMVRDVELHRATEIEPISGRIVRLARRLGMPALASEQAYRALKAVEASYLGQEASLALARQEAMWESEPF